MYETFSRLSRIGSFSNEDVYPHSRSTRWRHDFLLLSSRKMLYRKRLSLSLSLHTTIQQLDDNLKGTRRFQLLNIESATSSYRRPILFQFLFTRYKVPMLLPKELARRRRRRRGVMPSSSGGRDTTRTTITKHIVIWRQQKSRRRKMPEWKDVMARHCRSDDKGTFFHPHFLFLLLYQWEYIRRRRMMIH